MNPLFQMLDLVSKAEAVERLLSGKSPAEKIEWLAAQGRLRTKQRRLPIEEQVYTFGSSVGRTCSFFIKEDQFIFIGDHSTFTTPSSQDPESGSK